MSRVRAVGYIPKVTPPYLNHKDMIDPKELRIGNIVYVHGRKLSEPKLKELAIDKVVRQSCSQYDPIPITPKWLERLGFEHRPQTYCDIWEATITDYPDSNDNVALMVVFTTGQICVSIPEIERHDIKHIHQLQNIYFALTGTELTTRSR